jgi:hypothetical protein
MALIETTIKGASVHIRYADDPDPEKAQGWIDFQVPTAPLTLPAGERLGDLEGRLLRAIRVGALRYVRDQVDEEIRRLLSQ